MSRKSLYLILAVIGTAVPYYFFVPWFLENPGDVVAFLALAFANAPAAMLSADVAIAAAVLSIFALTQAARLGAGRVVAVIASTFLIGVSCGLPLLLYFREQADLRT